jgi:hypothetical protein
VRRYPGFPLSSPTVIDDLRGPAGAAPDSVVVPIHATSDSIRVRPGPRFGTDWLPADIALLDLVRTNAFRDPLCVSTTAGPNGMGWLAPYGRLDGLHWCITPVTGAGPDIDRLRANLFERHEYRGYADTTIPLEPVSITIGRLYVMALGELLSAERGAGEIDRCRADARHLLALVPPERLAFSSEERAKLEARCQR